MSAPVRRRRRLAAAGLAALAIGVGVALAPPPSVPAGPAAGAEAPADAPPAGPDPVATNLVDVAVLPAGGRDGAPRLLTLAHDGPTPGRATLTVLERGDGRWGARAGADHRPPTLARTAVPWLVALDEHRFVLVSVAPDAGVTWLRAVTWTGEELRLGRVASVPRTADAAASADVDGDGAAELVLVEARTRRGGPSCQGSRLTILETPALAVVREIEIANLRLAAGSVGELDGSPGADLAAAAYANCPAGPATPSRLRVVGVRLTDGQVLAERRIEAADPLIAWSGRPALVDVDRDGRHEVLVGSRQSLVVLDPDSGWEAIEVGGAPGVLLGASERPDTTGVTVATMSDDAVHISRLQRDGGSWTVATTLRVDEAAVGAGRWGAARLDVQATAIRAGSSGWLLGSPDCPLLVVALATAPCEAGTAARSGPAWVATRPIATLPDGHVLVAQTDAWQSPGMRLVAPSPSALEPPGGWRHGSSERFSLVEVGSGLEAALVPRTAVDSFAAGAPATVGIAGAPGTRIVTSTRNGTGPVPAGSLAGLLAELGRDGAPPNLARLPATGRVTLTLQRRQGGPPNWVVDHVAIGPLGDVSPVIGTSVELDAAPPAVALDEAFLRAPWPLAATVTGRTEPGATVAHGTSDVVVGADGRFSFETRLAPWPQRLALQATDPAGNVATATADVVGGPDLRHLPWIPIIAVTIVAGAALGGLRGRRPSRARPVDPAAPAVEELQPRRLQ